MSPRETIPALNVESAELQARLKPVQNEAHRRQRDLASLQQNLDRASIVLDGAVEHAAHVEGRKLSGEALSGDLEAARSQRQEAETAHALAVRAAGTIRALEREVAGLNSAITPISKRLGDIAIERRAAEENYVRACIDADAEQYTAATRTLVALAARLWAGNATLAGMAGVTPDILTGSTDSLMIPAFNSPAAKSPNGLLADAQAVRALVPAAIVEFRARIVADGVIIPGV